MTKRTLSPQACDACSSILLVTVGMSEAVRNEMDPFEDAGGTLEVPCPECGRTTAISAWGGSGDSAPDVQALVSLVALESRARKKYSDLFLEALGGGFEAWQRCTVRPADATATFEIEFRDGGRCGPVPITDEDLNGPLGLGPRLREVESLPRDV